MKKLTVLLLTLVMVLGMVSLSTAANVGIRTNPPLMISGFACDCSLVSCSCRQGDISVSVKLDPLDSSPYLTYRKSFFGDDYNCEELCLNYLGTPTSVKLPFSWDQMEASQHQIAMTLRERQNLIHKISTTLAKIKDSLGIGGTLDDVRMIEMEKHVSKMKSKAESMKIDTSLYFLTEIVNTFFNQTGGKPTLNDYFQAINFMTFLNREGKLPLFFDLYFAVKAKDVNNPLYQKYLCNGLEFLINDSVKCNLTSDGFKNAIQKIEEFKGRPIKDILKDKNIFSNSNVLFFVLRSEFKKTPNLSDIIYPIWNPAVYRITGDRLTSFLDFHKVEHVYTHEIKDLFNSDKPFNFVDDITPQIKSSQQKFEETDKKYTEYVQKRTKDEKGSNWFKYVLIIIIVVTIVYIIKKKNLFKKIRLKKS